MPSFILSESRANPLAPFALDKICAKIGCFSMNYRVRRANRVHIRAEERVELARKRQGCEYSRSEIPVVTRPIKEGILAMPSFILSESRANPLAPLALYKN
jgi:hypothetical protein